MKARGLYVTAGGFSVGIGKSFTIDSHCTDWVLGLDSLDHNFPDIPVYSDYREWPDDDVDLIYCAPPCAPFSPIGSGGESWRNDPRVDKLRRSIKYGLKIKPSIFILESLPSTPRKMGEIIDGFKESFQLEGYDTTEFYTGGILHGIPQRRIRWHLIAHRFRLTFPSISPGPTTYREAMARRRRTRLSDKRYSRIKGKVGQIMPHVPPGGSCRKTWATFYDQTTHLPGIPWRRCHYDRPSTAITGAIRQIHPTKNRVLTVGEIKALCGYPADWWSPDSLSKSYAYLGKGVLPPVGKYLGRLAAKSIGKGIPVKGGRDHLVDYRPQVNAIMRTFPRIDHEPIP